MKAAEIILSGFFRPDCRNHGRNSQNHIKNLLKMETSSEDRRNKFVSLTRKGDSLKKILPDKLFSHFDLLLKEFPSSSKKELLASLRELRKIMKDL